MRIHHCGGELERPSRFCPHCGLHVITHGKAFSVALVVLGALLFLYGMTKASDNREVSAVQRGDLPVAWDGLWKGGSVISKAMAVPTGTEVDVWITVGDMYRYKDFVKYAEEKHGQDGPFASALKEPDGSINEIGRIFLGTNQAARVATVGMDHPRRLELAFRIPKDAPQLEDTPIKIEAVVGRAMWDKGLSDGETWRFARWISLWVGVLFALAFWLNKRGLR